MRAPSIVPKKGSESAETSIGPPHARSTRAPASAGSRWRRPSSARAADARSPLKRPSSSAAAVPDRPAAAPHQHAPVRGRAEVVDEHAPVGDRLAAGPAELGDQLRHRLGEDDVAPEVGQLAGERAPAGLGGVRRHDDLVGEHAPARRVELVRRSGAQRRDARALVQLDPVGERGGAQRAGEPRRLDGRAVAEEHGAAKARRADAGATSSAESATASSGTPRLGRGAHGLLHRLVLSGRRRDLQVAALLEPDVGAARLAERADGRDDRVGAARDGERGLVPEDGAKACEVRPVAVEESAVAAARAPAADLRLEQDDAGGRVVLLDRERRPEPRVPAADHRDVGATSPSSGGAGAASPSCASASSSHQGGSAGATLGSGMARSYARP